MGTWGTGILDNDLALDIKALWNEYLADNYSPEDISETMISQAQEEGMLLEREDQYEFFIPFALIQWKSGRLQEDVKRLALEFLEDETISKIEETRWDNRKDFLKRIQNLTNLRSLLESEQPAPKKIKKPYKQKTSLNPGDLFTILLKSGHYALLEIIGIESRNGETTPISILYKYLSPNKPLPEFVKNLEILCFKDQEFERNKFSNFLLGAVKRKQDEPIARIEILERNRKSKFTRQMPMFLCFWDEIDTKLEDWIERYGS